MRMKLILSTMFFLVLANMLTVTFDAVHVVLSQDDVSWEILDEIGTYFELQNLSVSITTDTMVHIMLRASSSEMIGYFIENASEATSTQLTLGNLVPLTTYYMYKDSYINENVFTTDDVGSYTYTQDLSKIHHVFMQPKAGTIFIGESTTLEGNIYESVVITADNIVLDLNGYSIIGSGGCDWLGIDIVNRKNVTIKNGGIRNWMVGIYLYGTDFMIANNEITSNSWSGMELSDADSSMITDNNFVSNGYGFDLGWGSTDNMIFHNNFIDNKVKIYGGPWFNIWDNGYPSGGNYWSDYTGVDIYSGPYQNEPGSDGIGDTPYVIDGNNEDKYPFMDESGWLTPPVMIQKEMQIIESWELDGGFEESLISKLEAAIILVDQGNFNGAVHVLRGLIKVVTKDALYLTQEQKNYIIEATYEIIGLI